MIDKPRTIVQTDSTHLADSSSSVPSSRQRIFHSTDEDTCALVPVSNQHTKLAHQCHEPTGVGTPTISQYT